MDKYEKAAKQHMALSQELVFDGDILNVVQMMGNQVSENIDNAIAKHFQYDLSELRVIINEKKERDKGCEYCTGALPEDITPHSEYHKIIPENYTSAECVYIVKNIQSSEYHIEIGLSIERKCDYGAEIKIAYCPMCGRRLEK